MNNKIKTHRLFFNGLRKFPQQKRNLFGKFYCKKTGISKDEFYIRLSERTIGSENDLELLAQFQILLNTGKLTAFFKKNANKPKS